MRIGIDARLCLAERTGIGSYTAHLVQSFAEQATGDEFVLFSDRQIPVPAANFSNTVIGVRKRILWTLFCLPVALRSRKVDLFHGTANFELPPFAPCRLVSTVHDLIPLHFPELVSRKFYLLFRSLIGRAIRRSDRVITDSEYSRRDILRRFPVAPEKVVVVPLAPHPRFRPGQDRSADLAVREKYGLGGRYLLFVGVFEPRKNIPFLVDAFSALRRGASGGAGFQLALAGGPGYRGEEIAKEVRGRNLEPDVRLLGYVPDEELPALYREADLLVVPSRYEGFGLPALEAMACGTPVLAADSSSLPEIVGPAGELFPLGEPEALAERIAALMESRDTLDAMGRKGRSWASRFTWKETAARTLEVYREALEGSPGRLR